MSEKPPSILNTRLPFSTMNIPVAFDYTNYKGETETRRAILRDIYFGSTEYHPEEQWLVVGADLDKHADRTYALKDMRPVKAVAKHNTLYNPAKTEAVLEHLAKGAYFTIRIQNSPAMIRSDLPKQFTWMPTIDQIERAKKNHDGATLEHLNTRGGVSWGELAAILRNVPVTWMPELRAVAACTTLYPQVGFTL